MLSNVQKKMQEQGLTGYSSVRLTSRASHKLGKRRLSWVWLGFWLLSALSECSACLGRGSHRHASSGFVFGTDWPDSSVLTWPRPYICLSFYTHRAVYGGVSLTLLGSCCFSEKFLLHSWSWFYWGVSLTLFELVLLRSFSFTSQAGFSEEFLVHSSGWF